ncbi:Sequence-specific DNA binding transcription factor [Quillaja saponaria]|uniref:Sequence-specific DNA binding transcription factor n=1 Tax=Quillaja saponaria TaxID=32244 RepID=A0AAD7PWE4_QUISA|nr:Sequence-specific DNA binding transcription factor [Quillaja saponaria]
MEGNLSRGGMVPGGAPYCDFDLQGSMRVQHPHSVHHHQTHPRQGSLHSPIGFPLTMGSMQSCDQTISMADFGKGERSKNSASDEDEPSYTEGVDCYNEASRGKKGSPWQRVKWTDTMVRLLITAVSYIGEDTDFSGRGRRKFAVLQKKGKWKSVSTVMAERGYHVSPQQCEDKFNDLNKRYKRLNDMLGRGTSCQVVENPTLLDVIDYLTEKEKDDVRKILSSKHLFYEEMCSYHNGNRLHLPHDPALQRSLQLALKSRDDHDNDDVRRQRYDDLDEDDQDVETDDHDEFEEKQVVHGDNRGIYGVLSGTAMKLRQGQGLEDVTYLNSLNPQDYKKSHYPHSQVSQADMNQILPESVRAAWFQKQYIESRLLQIEEQKLKVQVETLELEKQRLKWQRVSKKRDRELDKLRMANERMKLENDRMALELKRKELGGFN